MKRTNAARGPEPSEANGRGSPPLADEIARRAYAYWQAEGSPEGADMRFWLRAEAEILAERGMPPPPPAEEHGGGSS